MLGLRAHPTGLNFLDSKWGPELVTSGICRDYQADNGGRYPALGRNS